MVNHHVSTSLDGPGSVYLDNATIMNACSLLRGGRGGDVFRLLDLETFCQAFLVHDTVRTIVGHSFMYAIERNHKVYSSLIERGILAPQRVNAGTVHYRIAGLDDLDKLAVTLDLDALRAEVTSLFPNGGPWQTPQDETDTQSMDSARGGLLFGRGTPRGDSYPCYYFPAAVRRVRQESELSLGWEIRHNRRTDWVDTFVSQTFLYLTGAFRTKSPLLCSSLRAPIVAELLAQLRQRSFSGAHVGLKGMSRFASGQIDAILEYIGEHPVTPIPLPALAYLLRRSPSRDSFVDVLIESRDRPECVAFRSWVKELELAWQRLDLSRVMVCLEQLRRAGQALDSGHQESLGAVLFAPGISSTDSDGMQDRNSLSCNVAFMTDIGSNLLRIGELREALEDLLGWTLSDEDLRALAHLEETCAARFAVPTSRLRPSIANQKIEVTMGDRFENVSNSTIVSRSLVERSFNQLTAIGDQESAQALEQLAAIVNASGNVAAAQQFDSINEELHRSEPRKGVLAALWSGLVAALPTLAGMTELVEKLSRLFGAIS